MIVRGYHGTTATVAQSLLSDTPFLESANEGDWLGSGVYFWQDAPGRADWWARTVAWENHDEPAVLVANIDLSSSLDLLDLWGFEELKRQYAIYAQIPSTPIQERLEINEEGKTVHSPASGRLVDRNRRDKAVIDFASTAIGRKRGKPITTVRGPFLWGKALYPQSFFFDWSNVQIAVRNRSAISDLALVPLR